MDKLKPKLRLRGYGLYKPAVVMFMAVFGVSVAYLTLNAKAAANTQNLPNRSYTYSGNTILLKLVPNAHQQLKTRGSHPSPTDTNLPKLDELNRAVQAVGLEQIAVTGKSSQTNEPLFRWYKLTLATGLKKQINPKTDKSDDQTIRQLIARYKAEPDIETAEPDFTATAQITPDDPYYSTTGSWGQSFDDLWGMKKINAASAWDSTTGSSSIVVAGIDTGIDRNHEDIAANMWVNNNEIRANGIDDDANGYIDDYYGWDFANNDNDPMDDNGHGTHTAGTIAAVGNNGLGVAGVSWSSKLMAVKSLNNTGSGPLDTGMRALQYAADMGAKVSSNSWGCWCTSAAIDDAVKYEHTKGTLTVAAAGNNTTDALDFSPANSDYAVTVSATDNEDAKAAFSNYGERIDVAAPGVDVLSLRAAGTDLYGDGQHFVPSGDTAAKYYRASGTSMAAPHASGLAALTLAKNPALSNDEVRQILRIGSDDIGTPGKDSSFGYGRINAAGSLTKAVHVLTPIITSPASRTALTGSSINITGSIAGPNFASYKLEYGLGRAPTNWVTFASSNTQVINGNLGTLNCGQLADGIYIVRLTATDTSGNAYQADVYDLAVHNFNAQITSPNQLIGKTLLTVTGTAQTINSVGFGHFGLEWGTGANPTAWSTTGITLTNNGLSAISSSKLGNWDTAALTTGETFSLRLTVYATDGRTAQQTVVVTVDKNLVNGWPKAFTSTSTGVLGVGGPVLADINGDGQKEILLEADMTDPSGTNRDGIYAYTKNGNLLPGWPASVQWPFQDQRPVTTADLYNNGQQEVIATGSYQLDVIKPDGSAAPGWPKLAASNYFSVAAVGDLFGDGHKKIVAAVEGTAYIDIYVFNTDGTNVTGFPKRIASSLQSPPSGYSAHKTKAISLADLDGSGQLSIIYAPSDYAIDKVYIINNKGVLRTGWPKSLGTDKVADQLAIGDINGDAKQDIVLTYHALTPTNGVGQNYVTAYDAGGNALANFPQAAGSGLGKLFTPLQPELADMTGDGRLDIVVPAYLDKSQPGCTPMIITYSGVLPSASDCNRWYPDDHEVLVDLDGSGDPEVLSNADSYETIHAIKQTRNSSLELYWQDAWLSGAQTNSASWPVVSDMDSNGKWDIAGRINLADYNSPFYAIWEPQSDNVARGPDWPQYLHDSAHTANYGNANSTSDTIPPSAPSNLTATAVSASQINLSWTASTDNVGVSSYDIYRNGTLVASSVTTTSFGESGLAANTAYSYYVIARDAAGNSSQASNTATATTFSSGDTSPPTTPASFTVTQISWSQNNLKWNASSDNVKVKGYDIYRNSVLIASNVAATGYADINLSAATIYTYFVKAKDAAGNASSPTSTITKATKALSTSRYADQTIVSGSTVFGPIDWQAITNGGTITKVDFYIDNLLKYTDTTSPYQYNSTGLDPLTLTVGSHAFKVVATYTSDNKTQSDSLTATVAR